MSSAPPTPATAPPSTSPPPAWYWRLLRAYTRRELPFWGRLYDLCGGYSEARWRDAGTVVMRGKAHGYVMPLDLSNWSERLTWFLGRYHDLPLYLAMHAFVHRGSTFVDVGANLGMISLLACRLTEPDGLVLACEPNPTLGDRLAQLAIDNAIQHLRVVRTALGNEAAEAELHEFDNHSGWGSLVAVAPPGSSKTATVPVRVAVGDDVLAEHLRDGRRHRELAIKIDVEGFEIPVLRGLHRTLSELSPLVFVEAVDENQRRAGYSLAELHAELEQHGYRGYHLWYRGGLRGKRLALIPVEQGHHDATDAMFVPRSGPHADRVAALLAN